MVMGSENFVPKIFQNLNIFAHLVVTAGWGSYLPKLAIFRSMLICYQTEDLV